MATPERQTGMYTEVILITFVIADFSLHLCSNWDTYNERTTPHIWNESLLLQEWSYNSQQCDDYTTIALTIRYTATKPLANYIH